MQPLNLMEYEPLARERIPSASYGFIAGGAEDEVTLRANRSAFERIRLRPRMLVGVANVDPGTEVLGRRIELPVLLAPVALQMLAHEEGELATARAAKAAGTIMALSTVASKTIEEVAEAADGPRWFQLYCNQNREACAELVRRAEAAGYSAVVLTVDVPWLGHREDDLRNKFAPPPGVVPKNLIGLVDIAAAFAGAASSPISPTQSAFSDPALTWADVDWLRSLTSLPLLLKGILTAEDALLALEHGVDGIIVSNHGGRQLDGAISSIEALPEVVEAVAGRAEVLLDSGVRRGTDVLKALALGAKAVLIGRPYIWGLAVDGEAGVRRVLSLLREEFALAMALAGCRSVAEIDPSRVRLGAE